MTVPPIGARLRRVRRAMLVGAICIFATATVTSTSHAAVAGNYAAGPLEYAPGSPLTSCRSWSGDADDAGRFYGVCPVMRDVNADGRGDVGTPALFEFDTNGRVAQIGYLPSEFYFDDKYRMRDVAVSPDGKFAYVSVGPLIDDLGQNPHLHYATGQPLANGAKSGMILRMARQADGSWAHDPSWRAGPFLLGNHYWAARYLDVDAAGRIYVAVNAYVYELSPTTAGIVTAFGGATTNGPGGAWVDGIDVAQGIAVAADGRSLYVVEQKYHLVQRWNRVGATDWVRDTSFLLGHAGREAENLCSTNDHFQSPYDVAVDAAGDVYVMDVTCNRIQRFTNTGAYVQTVWSNYALEQDRNHGFAVNWQGSIILPEQELRLVRTNPAVRPTTPPTGGGPTPVPGCADRTAPVITAATAPRTTTARHITLTVRSTDDCTGVAHLRVTGARAGAAAWTSGTSAPLTLTGGNGPKRLVVQARDGAGRISTRAVTVVVTLALPQPRLRARTVVRLAGTGCSGINPMTRVGGAASYRLVDRCARIAGRVLQVKRTSAGSTMEVLIPTTTARAIYTNAVGPVRLWMVADRRTRVLRTVRAGRAVVVVGSLVARRTLSMTYAVPLDSIAGS